MSKAALMLYMAVVLFGFATPVRSQDWHLDEMVGEWSGRYRCKGIEFEVTFFLKERGSSHLGEARITKIGTDGPESVHGIFAIVRGDFIAIRPLGWKNNLQRLNPFHVEGRISSNGKEFSGIVNKGTVNKCGEFSFRRTDRTVLDPSEIARQNKNPRYNKMKECRKIPDYGKRVNCVVEARNGSWFDTGRSNPLLKEDCELAFKNLDPNRLLECIGGILYVDGRKQTGVAILKESASCKEFMETARRIIKSKFPLETITYWSREPTTRRLCDNIDTVRMRLGFAPFGTCKNAGDDTTTELVSCSGVAPTDPEFARRWKTAFDECSTGRRIGMYSVVKSVRRDNLVLGLFRLSCADVLDLVRKHGIVQKNEIEKGIKKIAALEGNRPPRDDEVVEALKVALVEKYGCADNGRQLVILPVNKGL